MEPQTIFNIAHIYLLIVGLIGVDRIIRFIIFNKKLSVAEKVLFYTITMIFTINTGVSFIIFPAIGSYHIAKFQTNLLNKYKKI